MSAYALKVGDLLPALTVSLLNDDGTALDLSEDDLTVTARFGLAGGDTFTERDAVIEGDGTAGEVTINWEEGDTSEAGLMLIEFTVNFDAGAQTVPPNGTESFRIFERLPA